MTLTLETDGATAVFRRRFAAPPSRVWAAHHDPALIRRWLAGYEGWEMTECSHDGRVGGAFRYRWREVETGQELLITGEFLEIEAPRRMLHVERMFFPDPSPDNRIETIFEPDGTGTRMTLTMTLPSEEAMQAMIATGMADGMEHNYSRLDELVPA